MQKLYAATVLMQREEYPQSHGAGITIVSAGPTAVRSKPVLSLLWAESQEQARHDAKLSACNSFPDMKAVQTLVVQIPDDAIRSAASDLT